MKVKGIGGSDFQLMRLVSVLKALEDETDEDLGEQFLATEDAASSGESEKKNQKGKAPELKNKDDKSKDFPNLLKKSKPDLSKKPTPSLSALANQAKMGPDKQRKTPTQDDDPALAGLPKFKPQGKPDFSQDVDANPHVVEPLKSKGDQVPSLASLAKGQDNEEDPALKDLPKFSSNSEENPFGNPEFGDGPQKKEPSAFKKAAGALGKVGAGAGKALGKAAGKAGTAALNVAKNAASQAGNAAVNKFNQSAPGKALGTLKKYAQNPKDFKNSQNQSEPMPSMSSLAGNDNPNQGSKNPNMFDQDGKHWKVGDVVDLGLPSLKGLQVIRKDLNGWRLKSPKGGIYRFIPHKGLHKIGQE